MAGDDEGDLQRRILANAEVGLVTHIGDLIGYGRVMQLAEQIWSGKQNGGNHTVGPCAVFLVPCPHIEHGVPAHKCEICCGCGRVTKWVAAKAREIPQ